MERTVARAKVSSSTSPPPAPSGASRDPSKPYTVVARRYRPQTFEEVVGQDHVVQALRNAIKLDRVAQAYLFSGTRGVGKTSIARIFAKCLNCVKGPTETPCNVCDICQAISAGQDVDVIEIDGASNNGVEAVRELRQNAGLRPSRSRYKIYYIDEVHMLSTGAFNALLKTLEEPPSHVKFFFATTEPNKIPITVLSRCQRFDFAGIGPDQIAETLGTIVEREGLEADREALEIVARRALGSMRDAQSLLERLLGTGVSRLTVEVVQQTLGIAGDERVLELIEALAARDAAKALTLLDRAVGGGVQPADLLSGVLEFLRDAMVVAVGAGEVPLLAVSPSQRSRLEKAASAWPIDTILAAQQILAEARGRLRGSPYGRLIVELALCRVARLENLTELSELLERLEGLPADGSGGSSASEKKKAGELSRRPGPVAAARGSAGSPGPSAGSEAPARGVDGPGPGKARGNEEGQEKEVEAVAAGPGEGLGSAGGGDLLAAWEEMLGRLEEFGGRLRGMKPVSLDESGTLVVRYPPSYNWAANACKQPEELAKVEKTLSALLGRRISVEFSADPDAQELEERRRPVTGAEAGRAVADDPFVGLVIELFDARTLRVEMDSDSTPVDEG